MSCTIFWFAFSINLKRFSSFCNLKRFSSLWFESLKKVLIALLCQGCKKKIYLLVHFALRVISSRQRKIFSAFFNTDNHFVFCSNFNMLAAFIETYRIFKRKLTIGSSKRSLKCPLLYCGNLQKRICSSQEIICSDLKMVSFSLSQQSG